jgi:5,6-dimethylbenzimidazole synthase
MTRPAAPRPLDEDHQSLDASAAVPPQFDDAFKSRLAELFRWRRDVRRFRCDPIEVGVIEELVALATLAPSVGHSQPWRFVSVEDVGRRQAVIGNFNRCNAAALARYDGQEAELYARLKLAGLHEAPCQLAVFCETAPAEGRGLGRMTMPETLAYSVVGALQNLALAARARGLGVGWVSILDSCEMAQSLDVPAEWQFIAYLCIGRPEEEHLDPELERHGWQSRLPQSAVLFRR